MKSCSFVGTRGRIMQNPRWSGQILLVVACLPCIMQCQARDVWRARARAPAARARWHAGGRLALALQLSSQFRNQHLRYLATTCQPQPAPATVHTQLSRFACSWGFRSSEHTRIKRCRDWVINEFLSGIFLFFVNSCSRMVSSAMSQSTETVHC